MDVGTAQEDGVRIAGHLLLTNSEPVFGQDCYVLIATGQAQASSADYIQARFGEEIDLVLVCRGDVWTDQDDSVCAECAQRGAGGRGCGGYVGGGGGAHGSQDLAFAFEAGLH